jgi:NTE family protein
MSPQTTLNLATIDNLVLSGGGLLGISYIGLFRILEEQGITSATRRLKTITGCSAGAIFGSLLAIGYTSSEIHTIINTLNFKEYINITAETLLNFMRVKGLESGNKIMEFIKKTIQDKTGNQSITFLDVFQKYSILLRIGVTNLSQSKFQLLDYKTNPDLPIYQAIHASISIPFVFEPVIINGEVYCDGGLLDNLPIEYVIDLQSNIQLNKYISNVLPQEEQNQKKDHANDENTNEKTKTDENKTCEVPVTIRTLGIYLSNTSDNITADNYLNMTIYQYLSCVFHSMNLHPTLCKKAKENEKNYKIIIIEIPCDIMTFLKINASHDDIDNIITIAYDTIKKECNMN